MIDILSVLAASAAAGLRSGLPIFIIGLMRSALLWSDIPILAQIKQPVLIAIFTSWSLFELFGSKKLLGQRVLQIIQLISSPIIGGLMAATVVIHNQILQPLWLMIIIGAVLALVIKLVEVGWFFRLRGIPIWVTIIEDILCIFLVLFAFRSPFEGGLIAMLLLWLAIRSSGEWRRWYLAKKRSTAKPD